MSNPINAVNPIMSSYPQSSEVKFEAVYDMLHVRDVPTYQNDVTNKEYVDQQIKGAVDGLVDGAGEAFDTLLELKNALNSGSDVAGSLITNLTGQVADEQKRAEGEEARIEGLLGDEQKRAEGEEARIEGLLGDEQKRAEGEEARIESIVNTNKSEAETAVQALTDNKLDRNLLSGIDYGYEEDNITIKSVEVAPVINVKSGVISLGDRWRINCNAGADDVPRLVFEYKKVVDDDTTWVVGIPFIQSMPRS